jgi:transcriptional regulator with XRE-family HTH domain
VNTFAEGLRATRRKAGLTQVELARRSGIAPVTVIRYEAGEMQPNLSVVYALARALLVPASSLVGDGEPLDASRAAS